MISKIKVILTVECLEMKNPKLQRSRFDETMVGNSWILQENMSPVHHNNGAVSTKTIWGRTFAASSNEKKIKKQVKNLLSRAATYADIQKIESQLDINHISRADEDFQGTPVLLQDD